MRKILIIVVLLLLIWGSYTLVSNGVNYGSFGINSYKNLQDKSLQLNTSIQSLENLNTTQHDAKNRDLQTAVKEYQAQKAEYEALIPEMQREADMADYVPADLYDIDFLWTIIGNFATEEGVYLQFDVTNGTVSTTAVAGSGNFNFYNLNFKVSGEYISLTDFLYDLEDDDRLKFEISDFSMQKGGQNLQATFVVKNVPINNTNLTTLTKSVEVKEEENKDKNANTNTTTGGKTTVK